MTSGLFETFPVDSIIVNRSERQRKELRGIDELAESMHRLGQIHPLVLDEDDTLVSGERRLSAAKTLGWTHVSIQRSRDVDPLYLHALELEENVKRLDLTWQERALAMESYVALRFTQDPGKGLTEVAAEIGFDRRHVERHVAVAKALQSGNALVTGADKFSTALNIVEREASRKKANVTAALDTKVAEAIALPDDEPEPLVKKVPLLNEDFHDWAAAYCERKFNFIHCDFPYGVGMHNSDQGSGQEYGTYEDDKDVYWKLLETLKMGMDNVVADSAHLMFWFSMDFYQRTYDLLTEMGWRVNPFPLVWLKSDNTGIIPDANRGPRRVYETAFFAARGDRKIVRAKANAFAAPGKGKSVHMNEKPVPMLRHFMEMFVDEYSFVLDPTAGSANALRAAESLGASSVLGLERDPDFYTRACDAYYAPEPGAILGL